MSKDLVIVESPAKARTISRILDDSYTIMSSMGHVRDLIPKGLGVDVDDNFKPKYQISENRKKLIKELQDAVKKADIVYLATDPDREGEAIAWHLQEILQAKNKKVEFLRVAFHEITKTAVQKSFEDTGVVDMDRVNAQQARRVLDRLVGYKVSPILWKKVLPGTSAGRVQSIALRLICERQAIIDNFEPKEYWNISGDFMKDATKEQFTCKLAKIANEKMEIAAQDLAEHHATDAGNASYAVSSVKKSPRKRNPRAPFITSTLQQAASGNLRMSPEQTMRVAQQLYEGIDIDGEPTGLITYMRTDSFNIASIAKDAAKAYVEEKYGKDYYPEKPNVYKSRGNAQEAHEAIRPTDVNLKPEDLKSQLDEQQYKLYKLIWERFIASQMAPAQLIQYQIEITNDPSTAKHSYLFRATSTSVKFAGFMKVYDLQDISDDKKDDDDETKLPELTEKDVCSIEKINKDQKFTEPPAQFSEAMLVKELESNGVGRPSTYASIINVIKRREYVKKEKGKLTPTNLGKNVNTFLVSHLDQLFAVDFTAKMETELDDVEAGKEEWVSMLQRFYGNFVTWLEEASVNETVPEDEIVRKFLKVFENEINWAEPEKRGKRTYDDKKFVSSIHEQLDKEKPMSDRQWAALMALAVKYESEIPNLWTSVEELELVEAFAPIKERAAEEAAFEPDEITAGLLGLLAEISDWEKSKDKKRDDEAFYNSLKTQAGKKMLSPAQINAMKTLLRKYASQIPDYESKIPELDLPAPQSEADLERLKKVIGLADEIKEWAEPTKRGRFTYDDKKFVESITGQFADRSSLSEKQVAAFEKIIMKYKDQIENSEARFKELDIVDAATRNDTGIKCPRCDNENLGKKNYRGRTFFGCAAYPKCKYTTNSLDNLEDDE